MAENQTSRSQRTRDRAERTALESAEHVIHATEEQTQVVRRAAESSTDLLKTNGEAFMNIVESTMRFMTEITERNISECTRLFGTASNRARDVAEQSSRQAEVGGTLSNTLGQLSGESIKFAQRQTQKNIDHWQQFLNCRTPQDLFVAQSALMQDNLEELLHSWRRMTETSARAATAAGRHIAENAERASHAA
jgi:hypothetical protein